MRVKILEYRVDRGNKVKVQSHHCRKGVWKKNPKWTHHKQVVNDCAFVVEKKEYTKELNTDKGYTPKCQNNSQKKK